jgi:hypothetical protein
VKRSAPEKGRLTTVSLALALVVTMLSLAGATYMYFGLSAAGHAAGERLSWSAQVLLCGVALASALFVLPQLRGVSRSFQVQMFDQTAQRMQDLSKLLISCPAELAELSAAYEDDRPAPTLSRGGALVAEALLDFMDTELLRASAFPEATKGLPGFDPWFSDLFREYPGLGATLEKRKSWYSSQLYSQYLALRRPPTPVSSAV